MHVDSFYVMLVVIFVIIIAAFVIPTIRAFTKNELPPHLKKPKLDFVGIITNIILGIIYIPLSIFGSLLGMVSEGYMYDPTRLQSVFCDVIMILGFFTPVVCLAGITSSVLLRIRSRSVASFCVQFSGIIYMVFIFLLGLILDMV